MVRIMKMTTALSAFLGLLLATTVAGAADKFYKWTDAQGVTHYSEAPPPDSATKASAVKVRTKLPSGSAAAAEGLQKQRADADKPVKEGKDSKDDKTAKTSPAAAPAATGNTPDKYAEKCKKLQADLKILQEHGRVKVSDDKGADRIMTPEEKDSRTDDIQREIKAYCQ